VHDAPRRHATSPVASPPNANIARHIMARPDQLRDAGDADIAAAHGRGTRPLTRDKLVAARMPCTPPLVAPSRGIAQPAERTSRSGQTRPSLAGAAATKPHSCETAGHLLNLAAISALYRRPKLMPPPHRRSNLPRFSPLRHKRSRRCLPHETDTAQRPPSAPVRPSPLCARSPQTENQSAS